MGKTASMSSFDQWVDRWEIETWLEYFRILHYCASLITLGNFCTCLDVRLSSNSMLCNRCHPYQAFNQLHGQRCRVLCFCLLWHCGAFGGELRQPCVFFWFFFPCLIMCTRSSSPTEAVHLVISLWLGPPSEPLPPEIKYNPFEGWLICLSFHYTWSRSLPRRIMWHLNLNPSNELRFYWWSKVWEVSWLTNNPQSPFSHCFLRVYVFFVPFLFLCY